MEMNSLLGIEKHIIYTSILLSVINKEFKLTPIFLTFRRTHEMKNCVVAVDLGATSGRVILSYMENGRLISEEISRFENSIYNKDGKCFWNIDTLFGEIISGINKAITPERKILSIGVDTWGVDVAFIDKNGKIISDPRAYRDPYTEGAMSEFFKIIPRKNIYEKTGIQFMNFKMLLG